MDFLTVSSSRQGDVCGGSFKSKNGECKN